MDGVICQKGELNWKRLGIIHIILLSFLRHILVKVTHYPIYRNTIHKKLINNKIIQMCSLKKSCII